MSHDNEYPDSMVALLELIWGDGYMAPGGPGNVRRLLEGTEPAGKRILDVGCGIGGPAMEMCSVYGADVTGIDLEQPLIERAVSAASNRGLQERCRFQTVDAGPLCFADSSFDIVTSSGAITQTADKAMLLEECYRVVRPGGTVSCYEWMGNGSEQSKDLEYWIELEGLTYAFETLQQYADRFADAGLTNICATDASGWYRREARREYAAIKGRLYPQVVDLLGSDEADYFVENWRAMVVVTDSGEMRQGYCSGQKPITAS